MGRPISYCSIEGCEKRCAGRGWCRMHYARWWKHGDPLVTLTVPTGAHVVCQIEGCTKPHCSSGYCGMHYARFRKHGDADRVNCGTGPRLSMRGERNWRWGGDGVGYDAAHDRVRVRRGPARAHRCEFCGEAAVDWAYDHADPEERSDERRNGFVYSLNPDHYLPLCVACHRRFDGQRKVVS